MKPRKRRDKRCAGQVSKGALLNVSLSANPLVLFPRFRLKFQSIFFVIRKNFCVQYFGLLAGLKYIRKHV
jgi:hypothetical protein